MIPAAFWLVGYVLILGFCTLAGGFLFVLATAIWAAVDCSRLQPHGVRLLGVSFKPVVVFAYCMFPLCGLGFIWYLVLRNRVKSAPRETTSQATPESESEP